MAVGVEARSALHPRKLDIPTKVWYNVRVTPATPTSATTDLAVLGPTKRESICSVPSV